MTDLKTEYKFFRIIARPQKKTRKTVDYDVISIRQDVRLGTIAYYSNWRQHVLVPEPNTAWSQGCMAEINDFLKSIKRAHSGQ